MIICLRCSFLVQVLFFQCLLHCQSLLWVCFQQLQHPFHPFCWHLLAWNRFWVKFRKIWLEIVHLNYFRPIFPVRSPNHLENLKQLPNFWLPLEQWLALNQLKENTPNRPRINTLIVISGAEQKLRRSIPKRLNFFRHGLNSQTADSAKSKISNLNVSLFGNENIVRFEIPVENSFLMEVKGALKYVFDNRLWKRRENTLASFSFMPFLESSIRYLMYLLRS